MSTPVHPVATPLGLHIDSDLTARSRVRPIVLPVFVEHSISCFLLSYADELIK